MFNKLCLVNFVTLNCKGDFFMNEIMAIKINGRIANAPLVQVILTKYGCNIKTRVGFHETNDDKCSTDGIVILQLVGHKTDIQALHDELARLPGVTPKFIRFKE